MSMQPWPGLEPFARTVRLPRSGLEIFQYDSGPGEAVPWLLLHGLGDEADTWRHLFPTLAARGRVLAPDLPGFGRSQAAAGGYSLAFFQQVVLELLDAFAIQRIALAGHSLGASLAQAVALDQPERVERLVLIGGSLVAGRAGLNLELLLFLLPGVGEWQYNRLRRDPAAANRSLEPYYARLPALPEAERSFLFKRVNERVWSDSQRQAFLGMLRSLARELPARQKGLPRRLSESDIPTLAIWGAADRINSPANGQRLVELQPAARLVLVPEAGHNVHQERPAEVLAAMI